MSYQVLARKWRPANFNEMVGQEHVLRALINALDEQRLHHAYLFTGTRGVGKTTVARIFAKSLNCETGITSTPCGKCSACREIAEGRFVDLIEVDAASRTKVEDTRELLDNVQYAPTHGRFKVYLIDEVHMLSGHSFNALLKTLEEPPPHVKFLLATTDPQKLPVTILSRCLQFNLKRMPLSLIEGHLKYILEQEGIAAESQALRLLAYGADGSMRDALSLLDQAIAYGAGKLDTAEVQAMLGTVARDRVLALLEALINQDAALLMQEVSALSDISTDFDAVLSDLLLLIQQLAMAQQLPDGVDDELVEKQRLLDLASQVSGEDLQLYYQIGLLGRKDLPLAPEPRRGFEMILLRMLAFRPATDNRRPVSAAPTAARAPAPAQLPAAPATPTPTTSQAPAPSQAVAAAPVASVDFRNDWLGLVETLDIKGLVKQLASNCVLQGQQGDTIELVLNEEHSQLLSAQLEKKLQDALGKTLAKPVKLKITTGQPTQATPAQAQAQAKQDRLQQAQEAINNDPVVQALKDNFGATQIPDSVRPIDDMK